MPLYTASCPFRWHIWPLYDADNELAAGCTLDEDVHDDHCRPTRYTPRGLQRPPLHVYRLAPTAATAFILLMLQGHTSVNMHVTTRLSAENYLPPAAISDNDLRCASKAYSFSALIKQFAPRSETFSKLLRLIRLSLKRCTAYFATRLPFSSLHIFLPISYRLL